MKALSVGGTEDHVHTLLSLPATFAVAKAVQLIKGGSSNGFMTLIYTWGTLRGKRGTGLFSVNVSLIEQTIRYIERQAWTSQTKKRFKRNTSSLKRHGIEYDERYVLGLRFSRPDGTFVLSYSHRRWIAGLLSPMPSHGASESLHPHSEEDGYAGMFW